jgi:hypothetical protein
MRRRKLVRLVGADLDWFIIPIRKIAAWSLVGIVVAGAGFLGYRSYVKTRPSAEARARTEQPGRARLDRSVEAALRNPRDAGARGDRTHAITWLRAHDELGRA